MKNPALILLRTLTVAALLLGCVTGLRAQSAADKALYTRMSTKGPDAVSAMESVLASSEGHSPLVLYQASVVALVGKRPADAGFLFYAGYLRAQFDKAAFPTTGTDQAQRMATYGALRTAIGAALMPTLYDDPVAFGTALDKVTHWTPSVDKGYAPDWACAAPSDPAAAWASLETLRGKYFGGLAGFCSLLGKDEYKAAFRTAQDYLPATQRAGDAKPTAAQYDDARATMARIEKEQNIAGVSGRFAAAADQMTYTVAVRKQSNAGNVLFRDMLNAPGGIAMADALYFPKVTEREIVKIEVVVPYENGATGVEHWTVRHSEAATVTYEVYFIPDGKGGTTFSVKKP